MKAFDLIKSPVNGTNLIEAGAGTGKTYTITAIFLRLILERQLSAEQILVVTFTEAATAELKERIRNRLKQAQIYCMTGETDDPMITDLMAGLKDTQPALSLLTQAIRSFDQASIFTIHGFCYRVLNEHAFESGSLFDTELVTDQHEFIQEIIEDFWRRHIYTELPLFVQYVLGKVRCPENMVSFNESLFSHKHLSIVPEKKPHDISQLSDDFKKSFDEVAAAWKQSRSDVEALLLDKNRLNQRTYGASSVQSMIKQMDHLTRSSGNSPFLFKDFHKFTQSTITGNTKKKFEQDPPSHPFCELCDTFLQDQEKLVQAFEENLIILKIDLIEFLKQQLSVRKKEKNIRSFDDLLQHLDHVLNTAKSMESNALIHALRQKYKAALIDEFQDTDPIQYNIFSKLFASETHTLFLIGDPKQAIYGFRGADIFTYMTAAEKTDAQYTLGRNFRSDAALVNAVNTVFNHAVNPFVYNEIAFFPVRPALKRGDLPFVINGEKKPPFTIWYLPPENNKPVSKIVARERITCAVSAEISRLLHLSRENQAALDGNRITPGDIAVLVRRNTEAEVMKQALSDLNIKSVICSSGNIFDSVEAFEMERVLRGILSPNREAALKSALTTQMIGYTGNTLFSVMQEEPLYEELRERFRGYRQQWHTHGFIRMFNALIQKENVLPGLMALRDGERRCTNIRHLADILHKTSMHDHPGMEELVNWLSRQRDPDRPRAEEHQLRLESDENAVKIVTVHKSKGLEYAIVFCPFMWDGSKINKKSDYLIFHDSTDREQLVLDFGSEDFAEHTILAEKEILAENMRLLYVALTRAKTACYMVFGNINEADTSAPAHLFNPTGGKVNIYDRIREVAGRADGDIAITELPSEKGYVYTPGTTDIPVLECRNFTGDTERGRQFSSFTSLVHHHTSDTDSLEKHDEFHASMPQTDEKQDSIFYFPKGATSGTCLHDIFEHLDFENSDLSYQQQLVAEKLPAYGFDLKWLETVTQMIRRVLGSPLDEADPLFTLSRIPLSRRMNEMAFYFPMRRMTSDILKHTLASCGDSCISERFCDHIGSLNTRTIYGYLKGVVDLVFHYNHRFYILDWKSNFLGSRHDDYAPEALVPVMEKDFYILQYLIYTIAVNRYLEMRDPSYTYETGFGGVYYMFLRGIDPATAPFCGIYKHRPDEQLVRKLSDIMMEKGRTLNKCNG